MALPDIKKEGGKLKLEYYVFREDWNSKKIEAFNIFNHSRFYEDVKNALEKFDNKEEFAEEVKKSLMWCYWCKSEYEVVITTWPPRITMSALDRLNAKREESLKEYNREPYRLYVNPEVGEKIDIYSQVMLNWNVFVDYVWSRKKCNVCSSDYDQEIAATLYRFHSSSETTQKAIEVKYCPACGRKLN